LQQASHANKYFTLEKGYALKSDIPVSVRGRLEEVQGEHESSASKSELDTDCVTLPPVVSKANLGAEAKVTMNPEPHRPCIS
jgi:hypothetical protein